MRLTESQLRRLIREALLSEVDIEEVDAMCYAPKEGIAVGKRGITRDMLPHAVLPKALGI